MHHLSTAQGVVEIRRTYRSLSLTFAALAFSAPLAWAAGSYDGNWYLSAPQAEQVQPYPQGSGGCEAMRLPFKVEDNKITGSLDLAPYSSGRVEAGRTSSAPPISGPVSGTVQPDGTFTAQWQNFSATGKLSGDTAEMTFWTVACGKRKATGGRLKQ